MGTETGEESVSEREMFRFLSKSKSIWWLRRLQQLNCNQNVTASAETATATTPFPIYLVHLRSLSTTTTTTTTTSTRRRWSQSGGVSSSDFLVKSLGLSSDSESALQIKISSKRKHILLKSTTKAESVLALLRDYGFSPSDMAAIFFNNPVLLTYDPHKILKPKLDFFNQIGFSGDSLVEMLTNDPSVLTRSLEGKIIPCIKFLEAFFKGNTQPIVSLFSTKRGTMILRNFSERMAPNVEILRAHGVSDSNIAKFFFAREYTILYRDPNKLDQVVSEVKEMGFDPSSIMFVHAIRVFLGMKKVKWVSKMEVIKKSFGWTDQQVLALFVRQPQVMNLSEEKLKEALELFTKRLDWTAHDIAKYPSLLSCSIKKRILPRFSVLEILMSKGLVNKTCMGNAYKISEDKFLMKFVHKYEGDIPQLLEIYQKKVA